MAVHSRDLVRLSKTVRIRPRGVQRFMCRVKDSTRVGQEVLVEGTAKSNNELFVFPSLEVIRENGSLPLTLENQGGQTWNGGGQNHHASGTTSMDASGRGSQPVFGWG